MPDVVSELTSELERLSDAVLEMLPHAQHSLERVREHSRSAVANSCHPDLAFHDLRVVENSLGNIQREVPSVHQDEVEYRIRYFRGAILEALAWEMAECMLSDPYDSAWMKETRRAQLRRGVPAYGVRRVEYRENKDSVRDCLEPDPRDKYRSRCEMVVNSETCEIRSSVPHVDHEAMYAKEESDNWWNIWGTLEPNTVALQSSPLSPKSLRHTAEDVAAVAKCLCKHNTTATKLYTTGTPSFPLRRPSDVCLLDERAVELLKKRSASR